MANVKRISRSRDIYRHRYTPITPNLWGSLRSGFRSISSAHGETDFILAYYQPATGKA